MLTLYLYIFQGGFEVLNTIFQASMYVTIVTTIVPANTSMLNQRWNNVDRQRSSMFQQLWYLVENESWADIHLSMLFQRWQNNVETTLKELRRFSVDDPMLLQCWYLVKKESWVNICSSALRKQHWNTFVNICCTDVH